MNEFMAILNTPEAGYAILGGAAAGPALVVWAIKKLSNIDRRLVRIETILQLQRGKKVKDDDED